MSTASSHSPDILPRPPTSRRNGIRAAPKLRDSCGACSASKVKCGREKPRCVRCAKRGIECEYLVTKRAGRKHTSSVSSTVTAERSPERPSTEPAWSTSPALSGEDVNDIHNQRHHHHHRHNILSPPITRPSSGPQTPAHPDMLPDMLSQSGAAHSASSLLPNLTADFDSLIASPLSFSLLDPSGQEALAPLDGSSLPDLQEAVSFLGTEDAFLIGEDVMNTSQSGKPCFPINIGPFSTSSDESAQGMPPVEQPSLSSSAPPPPLSSLTPESSSCGCLIRALDHFKQLFPPRSNKCAQSRPQGSQKGNNVSGTLPTIQSVVADNAQIINAISAMLQCPCSQDGYLLAIMSLIVFKVLGWYAAAARGAPGPGTPGPNGLNFTQYQPSPSTQTEQVQHTPAVVGSYCIDGEDQGRMTAQLVLSELHRAQRLVNLLSKRLKDCGIGSPLSDSSSSDGGGSMFPFSSTLLKQLETDLRARLRALSVEIVDSLRRT